MGTTYGTLELKNPTNPATTDIEYVRFTGVTTNSDGTFTYTGLTRSLSTTAVPATSTGTGQIWGIGTIYDLTAFHDEIAEKLYGTEVLGYTTSGISAFPSIPAGQSRIAYNTTTNTLQGYIGASPAWTDIATVPSGVTYVTTNGVQTLTNKTMDGGSNIFTNIGISSLTGVLTGANGGT